MTVVTSTTTTRPSIATSSHSELEDLLNSLRCNRLIELRLGWQDAVNAIPNGRVLHSLSKALKINTSLRRISIGWHWFRTKPDLLLQILVTFAESIRPQQLQRIHLVLNRSIPASVLNKLLSSQTALSLIHLQAVTVRNKPSPRNSIQNKGSNNSDRMTERTVLDGGYSYCNSDEEVAKLTPSPRRSKWTKQGAVPQGLFSKRKVGDVAAAAPSSVVPIVWKSLLEHHHHKVLSDLRLIDCDLEDGDVLELAEHMLQTSYISVRGNRRLTGRAGAALVHVAQASLDLSLCDFTHYDCVIIAKAVEQRRKRMDDDHTPTLQEFCFAGNYRMELSGFDALLETCPYVFTSIDFSFCDLTEVITVHILQTLAAMGRREENWRIQDHNNQDIRNCSDYICLQDLTMKGCRIGSEDASHALVTLLGQNRPALRSLTLNDDRNERKYLSLVQMEQIAAVMPENYHVQQLCFDYHKNRNEQRKWNEIDGWLKLNRAGRRLLLWGSSSSDRNHLSPKRGTTDSAVMAAALVSEQDKWMDLLNSVKAENNMDLIYWVIRNSVERIKTHL